MTDLSTYQRWVLTQLETSSTAVLRVESNANHQFCQLYDAPKLTNVRIDTFHLLQPYLEEVGQEHGFRLFRPKR